MAKHVLTGVATDETGSVKLLTILVGTRNSGGALHMNTSMDVDDVPKALAAEAFDLLARIRREAKKARRAQRRLKR